MRSVCFAAAVCAVACSNSAPATVDSKVADTTSPDTGPDPNDGAKSGARLKITNWVFSDGTKAWAAFYDSQRKENCYIGNQWPDGNYYCEPSAASLYYSDAACSTKIGIVYQEPGCTQAPPGYILDDSYSATTCQYGPQHLYLRGNKISGTQYYYKTSTGTCSGPVTTTNYDFYAAGAEVSLSSLVKVDISAPSGTGNLQQRFVTSSDGLKFPWSVHDSALGTDCYPEDYDPSGTTAVCVPNNSRYASYDHDAACTIPELTQTHGCPAPQFAEYFPPNACPNDPPKYWAVGAQVTNTPLYYNNGSTCTPQTGGTTVDYYTTAQQLTLDTLTRSPDMLASHRIQIIHETTPEGLRVRDYSLWDQQQGFECYPTSMPDGTTRCFPSGGYIDTYYKDSTCTQPIDLVYLSPAGAGCGAPFVPKVATKYVPPANGSCAYSYEVHTVGAAYTGALYTNYGSCLAYAPGQAKLYTVSATPIDPINFAAANLVIDQ